MTENLIGPDDPDIPEEVPPHQIRLDNAAVAKRMLIWGIAILIFGLLYNVSFQLFSAQMQQYFLDLMIAVSIFGTMLQLCLMPLAGGLIAGSIVVRRLPERTPARLRA
ncbi:hypothetical protein K8P10_002706 [Leucobacter sp. Psy1]|uniref:hypothetical protein n=1 Tax=Leucobacter sp. Psy1 TaxID=2875729 RepID=UPI001CD72256|nr:hypothetical protein [Leucobacter sp. Psy1]UBH07195.1 hypothetical protein K8P10_002706 [Leucobacter sp. Psy1]